MTNVFNYIDKDSPVHALTGASKCACMILWSVAAMMTFCTPYLILLTVLALLAFKLSKIKLKEVRVLLLFTLVFLSECNLKIYFNGTCDHSVRRDNKPERVRCVPE